MTTTKTCRRCGEEKPRDTSFYRHEQMADGHLNICTSCVREQRRQHRAENGDRIREYDRARGFHNTDTAKQRARRAVAREVASGRLRRGTCEKCGSTDVQAHHDDYDRPLDVRWLCRTHHAELHRVYA